MHYKLGWAKVHGLRFHRLKLYGSEAGSGGWRGQRYYIFLSLSRKKVFAQDYTQRIQEGDIFRMMLSKVKPHRLRLSWVRLSRLSVHRLLRGPCFRLFRLCPIS